MSSFGRRHAVAILGTSVALIGAATPGLAATHSRTIKSPPGISGKVVAITTVPHSSRAMAIANTGNSKPDSGYVALERIRGTWHKLAAPVVGGKLGRTMSGITSVAAGSPTAIWAGGAYAPDDFDVVPAIWRWTGSKWVSQALPDISTTSVGVRSISASSATNAWAVGDLEDSDTEDATSLHWNGKAWAEVPLPLSGYGRQLTAVSTTSPTRTWAIEEYDDASRFKVVRWEAGRWAVVKSIPQGTDIDSIATTSQQLTYVTETKFVSASQRDSSVLRFNGKTWAKMSLPAADRHLAFLQIAAHGKSVWVITRNSEYADSVIHSDGGRWTTELKLPAPTSSFGGWSLGTISAESSKQALAGGGSVAGRTYITQSKGSTWTSESSK